MVKELVVVKSRIGPAKSRIFEAWFVGESLGAWLVWGSQQWGSDE